MVVFIVQNLNEIIDNAPSMLYKKEFAMTPYGGTLRLQFFKKIKIFSIFHLGFGYPFRNI